MTDLHHLLQATAKPLECQFIQFFTYQMLVCPPETVTRNAAYLSESTRTEIHSFGPSHSPRPQAKQHFDQRQLRPKVLWLWFGPRTRRPDDWLRRQTILPRAGDHVDLAKIHLCCGYVDIWSVGCIVAEMILGKVLFRRRDHVHQFTLTTELLGKPSEEIMKRVYSRSVWLRPATNATKG